MSPCAVCLGPFGSQSPQQVLFQADRAGPGVLPPQPRGAQGPEAVQLPPLHRQAHAVSVCARVSFVPMHWQDAALELDSKRQRWLAVAHSQGRRRRPREFMHQYYVPHCPWPLCRVKLCDFGCARHWETKKVPEKRIGRFGTFAGTLAYMSPQVGGAGAGLGELSKAGTCCSAAEGKPSAAKGIHGCHTSTELCCSTACLHACCVAAGVCRCCSRRSIQLTRTTRSRQTCGRWASC
jgi:serine/threonine protein kinase